MTTVINLWGGPGTGKSTSAAHLFGMAKIAGVNAELVQEYVKSWAWEGRTIHSFDQLYFSESRHVGNIHFTGRLIL